MFITELPVVDGCRRYRDEGERKYRATFPNDDFLILSVGSKRLWDHQTVLARIEKVWEFKHYNPIRGKYWTADWGVDYLFALPAKLIDLIPEKSGGSYVKVKVDGKDFTISCSGGTFPQGYWTDSVCHGSSWCVGHSLRNLKHLAKVALPATELQRLQIERDCTVEDRSKRWKELYAKNVVRKHIKIGDILCLDDGYNYHGQTEFQVKGVPNKHERYYVADAFYGLKVKYHQINYLKTAKANAWEIHEPKPFNRIGKLVTWEERHEQTA